MIYNLFSIDIFFLILCSIVTFLLLINYGNKSKSFQISSSINSIFIMGCIILGYIFFSGELNSLSDVALNGQNNLKWSYNYLKQDFSNNDYYVHILNKNKEISSINNDMVAGIKILKSNTNKDSVLVELKTIHKEGNEDNTIYTLKDEIALMHSQDIKAYLNNIYRSEQEGKSHEIWVRGEYISDNEKNTDLNDIKQMLKTN